MSGLQFFGNITFHHAIEDDEGFVSLVYVEVNNVVYHPLIHASLIDPEEGDIFEYDSITWDRSLLEEIPEEIIQGKLRELCS